MGETGVFPEARTDGSAGAPSRAQRPSSTETIFWRGPVAGTPGPAPQIRPSIAVSPYVRQPSAPALADGIRRTTSRAARRGPASTMPRTIKEGFGTPVDGVPITLHSSDARPSKDPVAHITSTSSAGLAISCQPRAECPLMRAMRRYCVAGNCFHKPGDPAWPHPGNFHGQGPCVAARLVAARLEDDRAKASYAPPSRAEWRGSAPPARPVPVPTDPAGQARRRQQSPPGDARPR